MTTSMEAAIKRGEDTVALLRGLGYHIDADELETHNRAFVRELDSLNAAVAEHLRRGFWATLLRRIRLT